VANDVTTVYVNNKLRSLVICIYIAATMNANLWITMVF